ncbi:hypothetical protein SLE2022_246960 [Rubroshorea leprosula]
MPGSWHGVAVTTPLCVHDRCRASWRRHGRNRSSWERHACAHESGQGLYAGTLRRPKALWVSALQVDRVLTCIK